MDLAHVLCVLCQFNLVNTQYVSQGLSKLADNGLVTNNSNLK